VRFAQVRSLLEPHGWSLIRISASHHIFQGAGREMDVIPVHAGRVRPVYVRRIEKAIADLRDQAG